MNLVKKDFPADQLTPMGAYAALAREGSCLLETVRGAGEGRHSFIGVEPAASFACKEGECEARIGSIVEKSQKDPYRELSHLELRLGMPAVGFVSYDAAGFGCAREDLLQLPDLFFQFYQSYLTFDHELGTVTCVASSDAEIENLLKQLKTAIPLAPILGGDSPSAEIEADISDAKYRDLVEKANEHLVAGDVFQVVLSRTFRMQIDASPFQVYRALRAKSPAPYLFFFNYGDLAILGASPEMLISVQGGRIETIPIAGTRPVGGSMEELLNDPKEISEHVMLVDLARNDLGSVCLPGTVEVMEYKQPRKFSHTIHIVSRVVGELDPRISALDALKAVFPAGTLTGAPKVRAMQLIDELEGSRRGLYGGAIVALDGKGNLKSCIAIRMAVLKEGMAFVRAGAGIVLDSDPQKEAEETRLKASTVLDALQFAVGGAS